MAAMLVFVSGVALAKLVEGTDGDNTLYGTNNPDVIKAYGGDDWL